MKNIPDNIKDEYEELKKQQELNNDEIQFHIDVADFLLDNELYKNAIEEYKIIIETKDYTSLYVKLAYCYLKLNDNNQALECFSKCKTDDQTLDMICECFSSTYTDNNESTLIMKYVEHINMLLESKQYDIVYEVIAKLAKYKLNDYSFYILGKTCYNHEFYEVAIPCFTKSLELIELETTLYLRALSYNAAEDYRKAVNDARILVDKNPDDLDYLYLLGRIYHSLLEYEQAYYIFEKILAEDETFQDSLYYMALILNLLCKNQQALECIEKSLGISATYNKVLLKTKINYNERFYDKAIQTVDLLIELKDTVEVANYILGLFLDADYFEKGIEFGLKHSKYNENSKYNNYMAKFYFSTQQYAKSLEYYEKILDNRSFHQERIHFFYGYCLEKLKDPKKALEHYKKSISYNKEYTNSIERIKELDGKHK